LDVFLCGSLLEASIGLFFEHALGILVWLGEKGEGEGEWRKGFVEVWGWDWGSY